MTGSAEVRILRPADAPALISLRREALESCPLAFSASVEDDRGLSLEFVRGSLGDPGRAAVFGLWSGEDLVGMAGLVREAKTKVRHKAHVWGMYVRPGHRRRGGGLPLLHAAVDHARSWTGVLQVHLSVSEAAPAASLLYRRAGFRAWGRQPRSLQWNDAFVDEHHLVLDLFPDAKPLPPSAPRS